MAPKKRGTAGFEVVIPVKRRYVPCSGPPPPPISLLPEKDSDAYIVGKIALPIVPVTDRSYQRRLCYIIGWPDLPQARVTVPCTRVLDYVSPRVLEDWEYEQALAKEEEELKKEEEEAAPRAKPGAAAAASAAAPGQKRRGRPPRARMMEAAPPTPTLNEAEEELLAKKKAAGPSLSTPRKPWRKLAEEEEDSEDAIARQLAGEETNTDELEAVDFLGSDRLDLATEADDTSRAGSMQPHGHPVPGASKLAAGTKGFPRLSLSFTHKGTPIVPHLQSYRTAPTPADGVLSGLSTPTSDELGTPSRLTPSDLMPSAKKAAGRQRHTPSSPDGSKRRRLDAAGHGPGPAPSATPAPRLPSGPAGNGFTPVPASQLRASQSSQPVKAESKTPVPSSSVPLAGGNASTPKRRSRKKKAASAAQDEVTVAPAEEQAWEVKRLEGDKYVEVDGQMIRYFKVRWEGDWPPDQNPTWEPEENIVPSLVKKYLRKKAERGGNGGATPRPAPKPKPLSTWVGKRYSSVAEAFAGEVEAGPAAAPNPNDAEEEDDDDDEDDSDELRVTEDKSAGSKPLTAPYTPTGNFDVDLARHYAMFFTREK